MNTSPITEIGTFESNLEPSVHALDLLNSRTTEALEPDFMVHLACGCQLVRVPHIENDALLSLKSPTQTESVKRHLKSARIRTLDRHGTTSVPHTHGLANAPP